MKRSSVILFISLSLASLIFIAVYCRPVASYGKKYDFHSDRGEKKYEVHPEINLPAYGLAILPSVDAYERLMDRYMTLTELNIIRIDSGLRDLSGRLKAMDSKLSELSASLDRIEQALGIEKPGEQEVQAADNNQQ